MTDTLRQGVLALIHSAVSGEAKTLPEGFDLEAAVPIVHAHKVGNLVYYGAVNCGIDPHSVVMQKLFTVTYKCMLVDEQQRREIEKLAAAFEHAGIDYLPLKGVMLKNLYPKTDMRIMGDADIMIRYEQYEKIKAVVEELGYTFKVETDHELVWDNSKLHLELHKRLVPAYNKDFASYYGDCWRLARTVSAATCEYEMSDEDHMIFLLTHFAKHYRNGGIGVRHVLDLYIYRNAKPNLDHQYIICELKKLKLDVFYEHILATISAWFEGGDHTESTRMISQHIFDGGAYGSSVGRSMADAIRDKAESGKTARQLKRERWWHAIFLPYDSMCIKYRWLKKCPVFLPLMWVVRWIDILFRSPNRVRAQSKKFALVEDTALDTYESQMQAVGLGFHFEENDQ